MNWFMYCMKQTFINITIYDIDVSFQLTITLGVFTGPSTKSFYIIYLINYFKSLTTCWGLYIYLFHRCSSVCFVEY